MVYDVRQQQSRQIFVKEEPVVVGTKTEDAGCRPGLLPIRNCRERERGPPRGLKVVHQKVTGVPGIENLRYAARQQEV
ncbi:hypothetical protein TNCV_2071011 [Trichonephila clavipes]|uniref:Uncharacterized protein n=1 Tax=Trichonephila clavipes TaxID=2585209 RepID=A0A8X7BD49_TRICX|nr:hypothetical protein TNCV_2071011 [Trichonephila clavipes]